MAAPRTRDKGLMLLTNRTVLIVDDSPDNRILLNLFLRRAGAKVDEASNGEEAISKAGKGNYDIVLMDIQMPGMDGYDTLKELKK
jgi:CheY-like chemotaxis protein